MPTTRKPKVSLQRHTGKPKEKPKPTEEAKATHLKTPTSPRKEIQETPTPEENLSKTGNDEKWQPVGTKHLLRSTTHRNEIRRISKHLESAIQNTKNKFPQWQITKFRSIQKKMADTHPLRLRMKENHEKLKELAIAMGQTEILEPRKEPTPQKDPKQNPTQPSPTSLTAEFNKNQEETEFDLESDQLDTTDMPDLYYRTEEDDELEKGKSDEDTSMPGLTKGQDESSTGSSIDLLGDQEDYEYDSEDETEMTEGAKFIINLTQTQNSLDNLEEIEANGKATTDGTIFTQMETGSQMTDQDKDGIDETEETNLSTRRQ